VSDGDNIAFSTNIGSYDEVSYSSPSTSTSTVSSAATVTSSAIAAAAAIKSAPNGHSTPAHQPEAMANGDVSLSGNLLHLPDNQSFDEIPLLAIFDDNLNASSKLS
jgi:hypothetical protein